MFTEITVSRIEEFSQQHNVDQAILTEFIEKLVPTMKRQQVGGRKAADTTLDAREKVKAIMDEIDNVSIKDIATRLNLEFSVVSNVFQFYARNGDIVKVGTRDKEPGTKGRREVLWSSK